MIILLCGYKGSGKDECAKHLERKHQFQHFKIATYLKDALSKLFGFTFEQLHGKEKDSIDPRWNITPRDAMKFIGTDLFQFEIQKLIPHLNRNFWVELMKNDIEKNRIKSLPIVISDLRFIHELDFIHRTFPNEHICLVKVLRSSINIQNNITDSSEDEHTKLMYNYIISNNDSIESLKILLNKLVARIESIHSLDEMFVID
jgi:hypothetical protein